MAAGKIFLCYRREDSAGHAGRIYDRLNQRFPGRVFMDVAGIGVGTRWAEVIEQTLGSCEVAVILIGRRWLERGPGGTRRIDDPEDSLRAEITTALRLKLKIIPLLVAGAAVPDDDDLPADVAPIVGWQALRIDDDDFDHDSSRLVRALESHLKDEGPDPHLESAGAKDSEIRRLLASAESCIAKGDWVTAAQTLQSVLSLDKTHAEAAAGLRFVQQQSAQAYKPPPPTPPKARAGRWLALGLVGGLGVAVVVVVLIVMAVLAYQKPSPSNPDPLFGPTNYVDDPEPVPAPAPEEPAAPSLAGEYEMASYSLQGIAYPITGTMSLAPVGDGRFHFETFVTNPALNASFFYRGVLEWQGTTWTTTTQQSNDPTAVIGVPIPTQVNFDGSALGMQNSYGQAAVWHKYQD